MAGVFTHNGNIVEGLPSAANMINYDNTSSGMQATQLQAAVDELNTNKQSKTDNSLTTTDKTITGGINELKSGLTNYHDGFKDAIGWDNHKNIAEPKITSSKTLSGIVLSPVLSDNTITGILIESGTTTGTINETLVAFSVKETGKYNIIGAKLSGEITSNYRTLIWDSTSSVSLIDRITENEFSVTLTSGHNYVIAINTANSVSIPQQTLNIMVCKESQGIIFEPYHPVIGPAVEDLDSRIEAVESGLTNVESALTNKISVEVGYILAQDSFETTLAAGGMYIMTCARFGVVDFSVLYTDSNNISVTHINTSEDLTFTTSGRTLNIANAASSGYRVSILRIFWN